MCSRIGPIMLRKVKNITHKTIAGFMALWLSGFVFLFCCETLNAKSMAKESCPLAKMSKHCDKAKQTNVSTPVVGSGHEDSFDCCGFLPVVFDKSRKTEQNQKQIATSPNVIAVKFTLPRFVITPHPISEFQSRVLDRHGTFVKNCVFRI